MVSGETREKLIKICSALNKHAVDYLVVGGAAVNFYGHYRRSSGIGHRPGLLVQTHD